MAEILHLGPYSREELALKRLGEFIREQEYVILGGHEEEYIVGPTQSGKGEPEKYVTIIRYRVRRPDKKSADSRFRPDMVPLQSVRTERDRA